jgi:prepilin-type N-terminal cleavage/methylation domain-containing protein
MKNIQMQRGFTLVELSISIVIMGLLIGGVLEGRSWVDDAKVVSTVSQVQSYSIAVRQFRSYFAASPGDLYRAGLRLPGCPGVNGAACNPVEGPVISVPTVPPTLYPWYDAANNPTATTGDDKLGDPVWNVTYGAPASTTTGGLTGANNVDDERYLFWTHLQLGGFISGVTLDGLYGSVPLALGKTSPTTSSGGGFIVGYSVRGVSPALTPKGPGAIQEAPPIAGVDGMVLVQVMDPKLALGTTAGRLPLTPNRAAQIDRKVDDGLPGTGFVQAYGVGNSCFASIPTLSAARVYDERVNSQDCGLIYRLGN